MEKKRKLGGEGARKKKERKGLLNKGRRKTAKKGK